MRFNPLLVVFVLLIGCNGPSFVEDTHPLPKAPKIQPAVEVITATAENIRNEAEDIVSAAGQGQVEAPDLTYWQQILDDGATILALTARLDDQAEALKASQGEIDALEAACAAVKTDAAKAVFAKDREITKLKDEAEKSNRRGWQRLAWVGGIMVAVAIGLMVFSPRMAPFGFAGAATGGTLVGLGTFMSTSGFIVSLVIGGIVVLVGALAGLWVYQKFQDNRAAAKAAAEEKASAMRVAKMARATLSDANEETAREFIAVLRTDWPEMDAAYKELS